VIGDKNSNNAMELVNIGKANKVKTYLISLPNEVKSLKIDGANKIGMCTSASTPKSIFDKVCQELVSKTN
ncbi:MAG: hypothetical protein K2M43_01595, partial [Mycoplasmoidaceae bacterium]|nr:hypothetical protein [Mycoplasmoidaceae bacterium]